MADSSRLKFYILCGNVTHNRGDRINLASQITLLRKSFPDAELTSDSFKPERDGAWYGIRMVKRSSILLNTEQIRYIREADYMVWGGGAILADNSCRLIIPYWYCLIWICKIILRKKIFAWAHGVVAETPAGRMGAALTVTLADRITVRDQASADILRKSGVKKQITVTADPAVLFRPRGSDVGTRLLDTVGISRTGKTLVGMSFTFWPFYSQNKDLLPYMLSAKLIRRKMHDLNRLQQYCNQIVLLSRKLIIEQDCSLIFVPKYTEYPWKDFELLNEVTREVGMPERCRIIRGDSLPAEDFFSIWNCLDFQIGSALHDGILSTACDIPCLNIFYESKNREYFRRFTHFEKMMTLDQFIDEGGADRAFESFLKIKSNWKSERSECRKCKDMAESDALKNIDLFEDFVNRFKKLSEGLCFFS